MSVPPYVEQFARTGVLQYPNGNQQYPGLQVVTGGESSGTTGSTGFSNANAGTVPMGYAQYQQPGVVPYPPPYFQGVNSVPTQSVAPPDWQQMLAAQSMPTSGSQSQQSAVPSNGTAKDSNSGIGGIGGITTLNLPKPTAPTAAPSNADQIAKVAASNVELLRVFLEHEERQPSQPPQQPMMWHPYYGWIPNPYQLPQYPGNQGLSATEPPFRPAERALTAPLKGTSSARITAVDSEDEGENMRKSRFLNQARTARVIRSSRATTSTVPTAESDQVEGPLNENEVETMEETGRGGYRSDIRLDTSVRDLSNGDSGSAPRPNSDNTVRGSSSSASVLARQSVDSRMSALSAISSKAYSDRIPPSRASVSQSPAPLRVSTLGNARVPLPSSPRQRAGFSKSPGPGQDSVLSTISQLRSRSESSANPHFDRSKSYVRARSSSPSRLARQESSIVRMPSILRAGHASGVKRMSEIPDDGVPWNSDSQQSPSSATAYPNLELHASSNAGRQIQGQVQENRKTPKTFEESYPEDSGSDEDEDVLDGYLDP